MKIRHISFVSALYEREANVGLTLDSYNMCYDVHPTLFVLFVDNQSSSLNIHLPHTNNNTHNHTRTCEAFAERALGTQALPPPAAWTGASDGHQNASVRLATGLTDRNIFVIVAGAAESFEIREVIHHLRVQALKHGYPALNDMIFRASVENQSQAVCSNPFTARRSLSVCERVNYGSALSLHSILSQ